jgi:hypothetical protein
MKHFSSMAIGILIAVASGTARADTVTDWNQTAIEVMKVARVAGNPWSRTLAMVQAHGTIPCGQKIETVEKTVSCHSRRSLAGRRVIRP